MDNKKVDKKMVHRRVDERTGTKSLTPKSTTLNFKSLCKKSISPAHWQGR